MKPTEEFMDVLQNLEFAVVQIYHAHPEMTNYVVLRAYEAAIAHYHAESRGLTPKPASLTGVDLEVFNGVKGVCEWRLGRAPAAKQEPDAEIQPISLEDLVACLRKLKKSVDHWTQEGGRQGYLEFVEKFIH